MRDEDLGARRTFPGDVNPGTLPTATGVVAPAPSSVTEASIAPLPTDAPASAPLQTVSPSSAKYRVVAHPDGTRRIAMFTPDQELVDLGLVNISAQDADKVLNASGSYDSENDSWDIPEASVKPLTDGRLGMLDYVFARYKKGEVGAVVSANGQKFLEGGQTLENMVAHADEELIKVRLGKDPSLAWRGGFGQFAADAIKQPIEGARFIAGASAEQIPRMAKAIGAAIRGGLKGGAAGGVAAAAGLATGPVGAAAAIGAVSGGAQVGAAYGSWDYFARSEAGNDAVEMARKGFDEKTIKRLAPLSGMIKGTMEMVSFSTMTAPLKKGFIQTVLNSGPVKSALTKWYVQYAASIGAEVTTEVAQTYVEFMVNDMAARAESKPELLTKPEEARDGYANAALEALGASLGLGAVGAGVEARAAYKETRKATREEVVAAKATEAKMEAEVKGRAPVVAEEAPAPTPTPEVRVVEGEVVSPAGTQARTSDPIQRYEADLYEALVAASGFDLGPKASAALKTALQTKDTTAMETAVAAIFDDPGNRDFDRTIVDALDTITMNKPEETESAVPAPALPATPEEGAQVAETPTLPSTPEEGTQTIETAIAAYEKGEITGEELVASLPQTPEEGQTPATPRAAMEQTVEAKAKKAEVTALKSEIRGIERELDALYADRTRRKAAGESLTVIDRQINALVDAKQELDYKRIAAEAPPKPKVERATKLEMKAATLADIADMAFTEGAREAENQARAEMAVAQEEFAAAKGELRAEAKKRLDAAKAQIATLKANATVRVKMVKEVIDANGLTAAEARRLLSDKKPLVTMSAQKFQEFFEDFKGRAEYAAKWKVAHERVKSVLKELGLRHESRIRTVLGLGSIKDMNLTQLEDYVKTLAQYEKGDELLSAKMTQALQATPLAGLDTMRQIRAAAAERLGTDPKLLSNLKFSELYNYAYDSVLAAQHPLLAFAVSQMKDAARKGTAMYLAWKDTNDKLAAAAVASRAKLRTRGENFIGMFVRQQTEVMQYIEAAADPETRAQMSAFLTPEELLWADKWLLDSRAMYDYLLTFQALTGSKHVGAYVPHIARPFLEMVKDIKTTGVKAFYREIRENFDKKQEEMSALDSAGNPLSYKQFLSNTLRRSGKLKPTRNVALAMDLYARKLFDKMAFDEVIPVVDATVKAVISGEKDEDARKSNALAQQFIKDFINSKKGISSYGPKQGGYIEAVLRFTQAGASLAYIQLNFALQFASPVGATVAEIPVLGWTGIAKAKKRKYSKQGRAIMAKYQAFIGATLKSEVFDPSKTVPEQVWKATSSIWHLIHSATMEDLLLGSMTDAEFAAGEISEARLTQIEVDAGRWMDIRGSKSVVGSTVPGASATQFKGWMVPPVATTLGLIKSVAKMSAKFATGDTSARLTRQEAADLGYLVQAGVGTYLAAAATGKYTDKDDPEYDSFKYRFMRYIIGELGSNLSIMQLGSVVAPFAGIAWALRLAASLSLLISAQKFWGDTDENEEKGERGRKMLRKQLPFSKAPGIGEAYDKILGTGEEE